jgi:hypothetical protein
MPGTFTSPTLLTEPGWMWRTPIDTVIDPEDWTIAAGKFTDAMPSALIPIGPTAEGYDLTIDQTAEPVRVAESRYPIDYDEGEASVTMAFAMAHWVLPNLEWALNGGTITTIGAGTGATKLTKYSMPEPNQTIRSQIVWESLDGSVRAIGYKTFNGGSKAFAFKQGKVNYARIPCTLQFQKVDGKPPIDFFFAGEGRAPAA